MLFCCGAGLLCCGAAVLLFVRLLFVGVFDDLSVELCVVRLFDRLFVCVYVSLFAYFIGFL